MAITIINYVHCKANPFNILPKKRLISEGIFMINIEVKYIRKFVKFTHSIKKNHRPHTLRAFRAIAFIF